MYRLQQYGKTLHEIVWYETAYLYVECIAYIRYVYYLYSSSTVHGTNNIILAVP